MVSHCDLNLRMGHASLTSHYDQNHKMDHVHPESHYDIITKMYFKVDTVIESTVREALFRQLLK